MSWDNIKFNKLCHLLGYPYSKVYQITLLWKFYCSHYHSRRSMIVWDEIAGKTVHIVSKEWSRIQDSSETEAVACTHVINTQVDVFLQIINASLLKNYFQEYDVAMWKIKDELIKHSDMTNILDELEKLDKSYEYNYIKAFDNTIKHRRLLDTNYVWDYKSINGLKKGIKFKEFEYEYRSKNKTKINKYPSTWAVDITEKYRKVIFNLISDVGNEMNKYLINLRKQSMQKTYDTSPLLNSKIFD